MKYGRKATIKGAHNPKNEKGFGPTLEHLSRYLNQNIKGLESRVIDGKVLGQTRRKKGVVIDIRAYFSDGKDDGRAEIHYSVGSRDGKKAKVRIEEIGNLFPKYSGPFASTPFSSY